MKKIFFTAVILVSCITFKVADAQVSVGLNIGVQPDWGPVGYSHADYYYIPDVDAYYDVYNHQYVYLDNGSWIHAGYLPARYSNYDLYGGYKVVLNERNPWEHENIYRSRYAGYRGRHDQSAIRFSHDPRYRNHYVDRRANDSYARNHGGRSGYVNHGTNHTSHHIDHGTNHTSNHIDHGTNHTSHHIDHGTNHTSNHIDHGTNHTSHHIDHGTNHTSNHINHGTNHTSHHATGGDHKEHK